jgi:SAM-dependent methyltransferase
VPWEVFEREAGHYEAWYATQRGRRADRAECDLLAWLLSGFPEARRVLEVGCGSGHFTRWLADRGLAPIGLDRSPAMLREARRHDRRGTYLLADAHALPLPERAVDVVVFVTTLEFLDSPTLALREAARVARHGLVLVVLNRWSLGAAARRGRGRSRSPLLACACDFSLPELLRMARAAADDRRTGLRWRSALLPLPCHRLVVPLPLGDVIGVSVGLAGRAPSEDGG